MRKAVIYTRVSTGPQEDGTSLAGQYAACLKKCEELGFTVTRHFEETRSGGLYMARQGIQSALELIESGAASALIIYRLDRTGRDVGDLRDIRSRVQAAGGQLVFADGMQFENSPTGNLMFTQLSAFAEYEREIIRDRSMTGLQRAAESGRMPLRHSPPYGYAIATKSDCITGVYPPNTEGHYFIIDEEARWVREMFQRVASGESLRAVSRYLAAMGVTGKKGGPWTASNLNRTLRNPVYCGTAIYRKRKTVADQSRMAHGLNIYVRQQRDRNEWIRIPTPPIVDIDLFRQANAVMTQGRALRSGPTPRRFLLPGLLLCSACGSRMRAIPSHPLGMVSGQMRYKYHHYLCTNAIGQRRSVSCSATASYDGPRLESLVIGALEVLLTQPDLMASAQREFERQLAQVAGPPDELVIANLRSEMSRLRKKALAAADAALETRIAGGDWAAYEKLRQDAEKALRNIEAELHAIEARIEAAKSAERPRTFSGRSAELITVLRSPEVTDAEKGQILRPIIERAYAFQRPETENAGPRQKDRLARVEIILRGRPQGPFYVLTSNRFSNEVALRIELENPYPYAAAHRSRLDTDLDASLNT